MYSTVREPATYTANMALLLNRHRRAFGEYWQQVVVLRTKLLAELLEARRAETAGFELRLRQQANSLEQLRQTAEQQRAEIERLIARLEDQAVAANTRYRDLKAHSVELALVLAEHRPGSLHRALRNLFLLLSPSAGPRHWKNLALWFKLIRDPRRRALWDRVFDASAYAAAHPDVMVSGASPSLHYLFCGYWEGRTAAPAFDARAYLQSRPDAAAAGVNPLLHYVLFGSSEM